MLVNKPHSDGGSIKDTRSDGEKLLNEPAGQVLVDHVVQNVARSPEGLSRMVLPCTADVPIRQPQKCRQCIRFYDRRFACLHLAVEEPPG